MPENKRIIIVLADQESAEPSWDQLRQHLEKMKLRNFTRSDQPGPTVVTCTIDANENIEALLENLNGMSAVRHAEQDSWSFSQ